MAYLCLTLFHLVSLKKNHKKSIIQAKIIEKSYKLKIDRQAIFASDF